MSHRFIIFLLFAAFPEVFMDNALRTEAQMKDCYSHCIKMLQPKALSNRNVSTIANHNGNYNYRIEFQNDQQCKTKCNVGRFTVIEHTSGNSVEVASTLKSEKNADHEIKKIFINDYGFRNSCIWNQNINCQQCAPGQTCKLIHWTASRPCRIECFYSRDPVVSVGLKNHTTNGGCRQTLYFMCTSAEITYAGATALFKFYWYVDGKETYVSNVVYKRDIEETYLTEFNGFSRLGVKIRCTYSTHNSFGDSGKPSLNSEDFFAGIKTLNTPITVERKGTAVIRFKLTVPVGCNCSTGNPSTLTVEMRSPDSARCDGINGIDECGLKIKSTEWTNTYSIVVKHSDNRKYYLKNPMRRIQLHTLDHYLHNIWSDVILPEISIRIVEDKQKWKEKVCYSHSDPHMMTFDQISYDNHNRGTYIMYESDDGRGNIMQVQTKLTECNKRSGPGIMCNCAVAVRAAADVYVINRCPDEEEEFGFKNCVDNVLDVRKEDEKNYMIYFPTGTHVHLTLWTYQSEDVIEVDIFPSDFDENNSKGLCSELKSNQLVGSDEKVYSLTGGRADEFSKTWLVQNEQNLLNMTNFENLERMKSLVSICTCKRNLNNRDFDNGAVVLCGKDAECPRPDTPVDSSKCIEREKRSTVPVFSYVPHQSKRTEKDHRTKRSAFPAVNQRIMSEEEANDFCKQFLNSSLGFQACSGLPALHPEKAIADCASDIRLTNTTAWASASLEGFKTICMRELRQNNTLQADGNTSIAAKIRSTLCRNECSGHGICINGKCLCDEHFGAADCSEDLRDPPAVFRVNPDSGGLCDDADCLQADVNGDRFLDERNLTCKFTRFQASRMNKKIFFESTTTSATHNTFVDIRCGVPDDRRNRTTFTSADRFVTGYMVSVSNNGIHFGSVSPIYILDSMCQDTVNVDGQLGFILKENFCFIRGRCILNGTEEGPNNCSLCNPEINAFGWTIQYEKNECPKPQFPDNIGSIILLICFTGILVICVLIVTLLVMKLKHRRRIAVTSIFRQPPPYTDAPKPKFHLELKHYSVSEA